VTPRPPLSLIVPVGPGEHDLPHVLSGIDGLPASWEIIVSLSQGSKLPLPARCRRVEGSAGRGLQLNRGIAAATGRWLWLLHADSVPDGAAIAGVDEQKNRNAAEIGYCDLRFQADGPRLASLNALGANCRSRWFNLPYGDQGYCVRRKDVERLGGFREDLTRGEDLDFVIRGRRSGLTLRRLGGTITTSARRYRSQGWLRTTVAHQIAAFRLIRAARRNPVVR